MVLARVRRTIRERGMLARGSGVLVGCSGGPDSVVLLHVMAALRDELQLRVEVACVDHGLRAEARDEAALVARLAESLGLPFHGLPVRVGAGASRQAQARAARYAALRGLASERGLAALAVGHTRDDQAETLVARLLRGSSCGGLAGIAPVRGDGVVRPLIDCGRAEVLAHARHFGLPYATDPSNHDPRYLRSQIRHGVLPALAQLDPAVVEHLARLADDARDARELLRERARAALAGAAEAAAGAELDARRLARELPLVQREALALWVEASTEMRPGRAQLDGLAQLLRQGGEVWLARGWRVRGTQGRLTLERATAGEHRMRGNSGGLIDGTP